MINSIVSAFAHWIRSAHRSVAYISVCIPEVAGVAPDADRVAYDKPACSGVEIARAVVVKARFGIIPAAGEEGRVADGTIGQRRAGDVEERRQAVIIVAV